MGLVYGVGISDLPTKSNGKLIREYYLWRGILERCYSERLLAKNPTYSGCFISEEWKTFSNFKKDIINIKNFDRVGWNLDKDLIVKGNKEYGKDTVCFVPQDINKLVINCKGARGEYPIGVYFKRSMKTKPYAATCAAFGKTKHLGYYASVEEAFNAYRIFKEEQIKLKALSYRNELDIRVFQSLMNWKIEIYD